MTAAARFRYQPGYCEENVWWLCQEPELRATDPWAVFVSNAARRCAFREQRAAPVGEVVLWDYHVVLLVPAPSGPAIWDLDSRLPLPVPVARYLEATFPRLAPELSSLAPRFRLLRASELLAHLSSDRSHMRVARGARGKTHWLAPPPPWPPPVLPGQPMNLMRFVDMEEAFLGEVLDRQALLDRFG